MPHPVLIVLSIAIMGMIVVLSPFLMLVMVADVEFGDYVPPPKGGHID